LSGHLSTHTYYVVFYVVAVNERAGKPTTGYCDTQ